MVIVRTAEDFKPFYKKFSTLKNATIIPVLCDHKDHVKMNELCLLYVKILDDEYILSFNHNESTNLPSKVIDKLLEVETKIWTDNKKNLAHTLPFKHIADYTLLNFLNGKSPTDIELTKSHQLIYRTFYKEKNLNCAVPILKHLEVCRTRVMNTPEWQSSFIKYNNEVINTLIDIESNGIHVNFDEFTNYYQKPELVNSNGLVFSSYNVYTAAGRPSNKFGGINYAALNKKSGIRKSFDSRFDDGKLIQLDYDSYHLRLIANILKYDLPTHESAHHYLGTHYFDNDILTEDQLQEAKSMNFQILYGGIPDELLSIPFLKQTKELQDKIFKFTKERGELFSVRYHKPVYLHKIDGINKEKIFNYLLQHEETERTIYITNKVNQYLKNKQSVVIMYNYDALVIDYCPADGNILDDIKKIMNPDGKFPTTVSIGTNYNDLIKIK